MDCSDLPPALPEALPAGPSHAESDLFLGVDRRGKSPLEADLERCLGPSVSAFSGSRIADPPGRTTPGIEVWNSGSALWMII